MINAGLAVVGQIFPQDDLGRVTLTEMIGTLIYQCFKELHYSTGKYNQEKIPKQRTQSTARSNHNTRKSTKGIQARVLHTKGSKKILAMGKDTEKLPHIHDG